MLAESNVLCSFLFDALKAPTISMTVLCVTRMAPPRHSFHPVGTPLAQCSPHHQEPPASEVSQKSASVTRATRAQTCSHRRSTAAAALCTPLKIRRLPLAPSHVRPRSRAQSLCVGCGRAPPSAPLSWQRSMAFSSCRLRRCLLMGSSAIVGYRCRGGVYADCIGDAV